MLLTWVFTVSGDNQTRAAISALDAGVIFTQPELSRIGLVVLLSLWVIAMGAFRLRDAVAFDGDIRANWVLVFLSMLAIVAGCEGLLAPNEAVVGVMINVWIFPILNGITLITTAAGHRATGLPTGSATTVKL